MRRHLLFVIILILTLSSCFRESDRFPVGVDPFSLIESDIPGYYIDTTITEAMNYYIPSQSDESYLLVDKKAIEESILVRGDFIWFGKVTDFTARDSVFISNHFSPVSETYFLGVYRDSTLICQENRIFKDYVKVNIRTEIVSSDTKYITWGEELLELITPENLTQEDDLLSFNLAKSSEFKLVNPETGSNNLSVPYSNSPKFILSSDFAGYIPGELSTAETTILLKSNVPSVNLQEIYTLYSNIFIHPYSFSIDFGSIVFGDQCAVLRYSKLESEAPDMLILNNNSSPQSYEIESRYWELDSETFSVYPNKTGDYVFVQQDNTTTLHSIPLDGTFTSVYLDGVFLDLSNVSLPGGFLEFYLDSDITDWEAKFGVDSYNLANPDSIYHFKFVLNEQTLYELPDDDYIEAGIPSSPESLFYHQDTGNKLYVDYLTADTGYDQTHFSVTDNIAYFGLKTTSDYFFADYTPSDTSKSLLLPYSEVWYNLGDITFFNNNTASGIDRIDISYDSPLDWDNKFGSSSYNLSEPTLAYNFRLYSAGQIVLGLTDGDYLEIGVPAPTGSQAFFYHQDTGSMLRIDYLTEGTKYDPEHYTVVDSKAYFGLNSTCEQFFSSYTPDTNDKSLFLPYPDTWINLGNLTVFNNQTTSEINRIDIRFNADIPFANSLFNGSPYTLGSSPNAVELTLYQDNSLINILGNDDYLEIGISDSFFNSASNSPLFTVVATPEKAIVDLKEQATEYDAEHYAHSNDFYYFGINASSTTFISDYSMDADMISITLPRPLNEIETDAFTFINSEHIGCDRISLFLNPDIDYIPEFFQGNPYSISNPREFLKVDLFSFGSFVSNLATGEYFFFEIPYSESVNDNSVVFDVQSTTVTNSIFYSAYTTNRNAENDFQYENNRLIIPITRSSSRFLTELLPQQAEFAFPLLVPDTNLITNGVSCFAHLTASVSGSFADNLFLHINTTDTLPYEIIPIFNQYDMSLTSSVYDITLSDNNNTVLDSLLEVINPVLEFDSNSISDYVGFFDPDTRNRFYTYPMGQDLDGYHFTLSNDRAAITGHNAGFYFATQDVTTSNISTVSLTSLADAVNVSLYQNQFMLPAYYLPFYFAVGNQVRMTMEVPINGYNPVSSLRLDFLDSSNQQIDTNFIFDYINDEMPLLYISFPAQYVGTLLHLYFRDFQGIVTEYSFVSQFSELEFYNEFIIYGNSCIIVVNKPGYFFITQ